MTKKMDSNANAKANKPAKKCANCGFNKGKEVTTEQKVEALETKLNEVVQLLNELVASKGNDAEAVPSADETEWVAQATEAENEDFAKVVDETLGDKDTEEPAEEKVTTADKVKELLSKVDLLIDERNELEAEIAEIRSIVYDSDRSEEDLGEYWNKLGECKKQRDQLELEIDKTFATINRIQHEKPKRNGGEGQTTLGEVITQIFQSGMPVPTIRIVRETPMDEGCGVARCCFEPCFPPILNDIIQDFIRTF